MKRRLFLWLSLALATGLLAVGPMGSAWAQEKPIRFGLIPSEDAVKLLKDSAPFVAALENALGLKV